MFKTAVENSLGSFDVVTEDDRRLTIPDDMANRDRRQLAAWVAAGGIVDPFDREAHAAAEAEAAQTTADRQALHDAAVARAAAEIVADETADVALKAAAEREQARRVAKAPG